MKTFFFWSSPEFGEKKCSICIFLLVFTEFSHLNMLKIGQNWGKIANYPPPPMLNKDRHHCLFRTFDTNLFHRTVTARSRIWLAFVWEFVYQVCTIIHLGVRVLQTQSSSDEIGAKNVVISQTSPIQTPALNPALNTTSPTLPPPIQLRNIVPKAQGPITILQSKPGQVIKLIPPSQVSSFELFVVWMKNTSWITCQFGRVVTRLSLGAGRLKFESLADQIGHSVFQRTSRNFRSKSLERKDLNSNQFSFEALSNIYSQITLENLNLGR